jgi:hypothetical protein
LVVHTSQLRDWVKKFGDFRHAIFGQRVAPQNQQRCSHVGVHRFPLRKAPPKRGQLRSLWRFIRNESSGKVPLSCYREFSHFILITIGWYDDFNSHPFLAELDQNSNPTFFMDPAIREHRLNFHKRNRNDILTTIARKLQELGYRHQHNFLD